MPTITPVCGDLTTQQVDAIVTSTNRAMRGGGGLDGAVHRAGGPAILRDCITRFPHGLATGDAGWTTAGTLPARWVIHTVGPNHAAGERDRSLLESCYRRTLEVADGLGAHNVAFPLIGAGSYGWPRSEAIAVAIDTIAGTGTRVEEIRLVANEQAVYEEIHATLAQWTPFRILQGVRVLHLSGYHRVRVRPTVSPSGMHWRATITVEPGAHEGTDQPGNPGSGRTLRYTTGNLTLVGSAHVTRATSPETVAGILHAGLAPVGPTADDPDYVAWYAGLIDLVERNHALPVSGADGFDDSAGWEIGWGSGLRYPHPPRHR